MAQGMTRSEQQADYAYILPDGQAFYTPDGEGRIWYDSEEDLLEEHTPDGTVLLDVDPEDY